MIIDTSHVLYIDHLIKFVDIQVHPLQSLSEKERSVVKLILQMADAIRKKAQRTSLTDILTLFVYNLHIREVYKSIDFLNKNQANFYFIG